MIEYGNLIYEDNSFERVIDVVEGAKELTFHKNTIQILDSTDKHIFDVTNVEVVNFNKKLYYIPKNFLSQSKVKNVDLSKTNIVSIHKNAFHCCKNLEKIFFPKSLEKLGSNVFRYCENLKEIDLSNTKLERIENESFSFCENLSKIVFPNTLKEIDNFVFIGCENLKKIVLPNNFEKWCSSLFMYNGIKKIYYNTLKEDVKKTLLEHCQKEGIQLVANDLDTLLSESKSFKDINNFYKDIER